MINDSSYNYKNYFYYFYVFILDLVGADLESFAKHCRRTTINQDDVKLLGRRNESLLTSLNEFIINYNSTKKEKELKN